MIKAVRGTRDLLPPDTDLWNRVDAKVRDVFARYNFHEIRTPIFEDTQLFSRSVGEETDIVSKEMFTWEDKARAQSEKAQSLTLASGEHGRRSARLHRAWSGRQRYAAEAVLHWPAVSPRASAEGTISPVLSDRRGDHRAAERGQRVSGARCRGAGDAGHAARRSRPARLAICS